MKKIDCNDRQRVRKDQRYLHIHVGQEHQAISVFADSPHHFLFEFKLPGVCPYCGSSLGDALFEDHLREVHQGRDLRRHYLFPRLEKLLAALQKDIFAAFQGGR